MFLHIFWDIADFVKWPIAVILMLLVLYIAVRISGAAWYRSKAEAMVTSRRALKKLFAKEETSLKDRK